MTLTDITTDDSTSPINITTGDSDSPTTINFYSLHYTQSAVWIIKVLLPTAFVLGVVGNLMTVVILRRLKTSRSALDRYFLSLAVADLCVNIMGPMPVWFRILTGFRLLGLHDVVCKIDSFVLNTGTFCSAWMVVVIAAQRAMSVVWPHRVNVMCTARTSWGVITTIVVVFSMFNAHYLYGNEVSNGACKPRPDYFDFLVQVWGKVDIFFFSLLPFLCLMISNTVLVVKLRTSVKEAGDQFATTDRQQSERERKVNSITLTALAVSVSFVVLTLPLAAKNMAEFTLLLSTKKHDVHQLAFDYFLQALFSCVAYFNFSMNFYLYCLTGRRFRVEFQKTVCGLLTCFRSVSM